MHPIITCFLLIVTLPAFGQKTAYPSLDQFVGYYDVGVRPNRPFFKSRWYLKEGKLFTIYDSDIDRAFVPYVDGAPATTVFFSEEEVEITDTDSTYYLVLNFEDDQLESFRVIRPRSEWPTDLYGYRNEALNELAIHTEEALSNRTETEHFIFEYSDIDTMLIPDVASKLEVNYSSLIEQFGLEDFPKTTIRIYPNLETYHNAVLTPGAPQWQMGRAWDTNEIRMLSTVVAKEIMGEIDDTAELILHEFIHCIHLSMIPDTQNPVGWLWEGIATYKGCCKWINSPYEHKGLKKRKKITLKSIDKDRTFELKYVLGYFLIEYIEQTFGWDSVLDLIRTNGDIAQSLGLSVKDFERDFNDYLAQNY
ncbi:MAG: hypothetical protein HRT61_01275 [Ekhidna sp.]|nr:hypothetical protein [Ekhidna sp.]